MQVDYTKYYLFIAGISLPIIDFVIGTGYNQLANVNFSLDYSPYLMGLHKNTKFQLWSQESDSEDPKLEFDGIIVQKSKSRNVLGNVSIRLGCYSDGVIWQQRTQINYTIEDAAISSAAIGKDAKVILNLPIEDYLSTVVRANRFDVGCSVSSILSGNVIHKKGENNNFYKSYNTYYYNGKRFYSIFQGDTVGGQSSNPPYYEKFLNDYKLKNKIYGITTNSVVKTYFNYEQFFKLIGNDSQSELHGENAYWQIASIVLRYGFHDVFDIPNPVFIDKTNSAKNAELVNSDNSIEVTPQDEDKVIDKSDKVTVIKDRNFSGLAQYVIKPRSTISLPFKCNIIFPDQIISENLTYNTFNEPTRVRFSRSYIPGEESGNQLTSDIYVGPHCKSENKDNYFACYNSKAIVPKVDAARNQNFYSEYEKYNGLSSVDINLSHAMQEALLHEDKSKLTESDIQKITHFINYEFVNKFFKARQYSISVDPSVNVVPGLPLIVLSAEGDHIICYCVGYNKSWSAGGSAQTQVNVAYPRYFYEDISDISAETDPLVASDEDGKINYSIKEMELILGTEAFVSKNVYKNHGDFVKAINDLFTEYINSSDEQKESIKNKYSRRKNICSFKQFYSLFADDSQNFNIKQYPDNLQKIMDSTEKEEALSCNKLQVYDKLNSELPKDGTATSYLRDFSNKSNSKLINAHNTYISIPQKI